MKYSFSWLKELSGTKKTPEQVVEFLTMKSMEVEGVSKSGQIPDGVVVGKILEIRKHPNAERLQIATVETHCNASLPVQKLQIVCGAPNIQVGQMVPVATVGTVLPASSAGESEGLKIKEAEIRGEKSFGMLCAEDELGLGEDHSGILILPKKANVGEPVSKYIGSNDTIIEIKVLPDRAHDCLSHVGVAREICVLENNKFDYDFDGLKIAKADQKKANKSGIKIEIKDKKLCSRYIGAIMTGVEIKPSPKWMQERLRACGMNVINNVVDATNYVMLELGQPLHAFDFKKILAKTESNSVPELDSGRIVVRRAKKDEKMALLDESEINLTEDDLLITDGENPLALAGIKGGLKSGIDENTKTIVLEAASFNAVNIRRTRTRLGIQTESSQRFEKDLDPNLTEKAMVRLVEILEHTAGAKLGGIVDEYPHPVKPWKVKLDLDYASRLLGENVPVKEVANILKSLSFKVAGKGKNLMVEVPTFRLDVRTQEDLIEEIGRVWGYEKIQTQPLMEPIEPAKINEQSFFERKVKNILAGLGMDEMYNYSFYSKRDAEICALNVVKHYELANPMNADQELVRVSLAPNILKNVRENLKHFEDFGIFEIGRVYYPNNNKIEERRMLAMAKVLEADPSADTFHNLKGVLEDLLESLGIENVSVEKVDLLNNHLGHPERSAEIKISDAKIGYIGEINPRILASYKIRKRVAMVEIDLEKLREVVPQEKKYESLPKYPIITRDATFIVNEKITAEEIFTESMNLGTPMLFGGSFKGEYMKDNSKRYTFSFRFMSDNRTLEKKEVDEVMEKIILGLEKKLRLEVVK